MAEQHVLVPDIGDFDSVEVIEILVKEGDKVATEDSLITLESDKASMEIPSPAAGEIKSLLVKLGDTVAEGDPILVLTSTDNSSAGGTTEATQSQPTSKTASTDSQTVEVRVPDIGDFEAVEVIEILVRVGDEVTAEDSLITLESDKASMEIPSPQTGTVTDIQVKLGDSVSQGDLILALAGSSNHTAKSTSAPNTAPITAATPPTTPPTATMTQATTTELPNHKEAMRRSSPTAHIDETKFRKAHASPAVRRFARELGADLGLIKGSGPKARILKEDVKTFVKQALSGAPINLGATSATGGAGIPAMPEVDFSKFGEIEIQQLPRIKKISGSHLHRAWLNVPHVTQHDEADVTELESFRKSLQAEAERKGTRITALYFIMKALAAALRQFPLFNTSLTADAQSLVYKKYIHLGIAVDTPKGLMVPVIRDVDKKSLWELAFEVADISARAREAKLKPTEMQGGCMSISSLGGIGGTSFTPLVNAPEVAILGVSRSKMSPVWTGKEFAPRLMLPVSLSYDHRVVDGAEAARFTRFVCDHLSDIRRLLL